VGGKDASDRPKSFKGIDLETIEQEKPKGRFVHPDSQAASPTISVPAQEDQAIGTPKVFCTQTDVHGTFPDYASKPDFGRRFFRDSSFQIGRLPSKIQGKTNQKPGSIFGKNGLISISKDNQKRRDAIANYQLDK
jgi:hypothetical protein